MKTFFVCALLTLAIVYTNAQDSQKGEKELKNSDIPAAVKASFTKQFAKATKVEWSLEKEGEYEAEFKLDKSEMSANFDEKGTLLETETEIKESELPQAIKAAIAKDFTGYKLKEISKVESNNIESYEIEAELNHVTWELIFDNKGKLIKKEQEKDEDKD